MKWVKTWFVQTYDTNISFMVWHKQVCSQSNFAYISQNYPTQQNNYILHETLVTALFQIEIAIILVIISSNHGKWQKIFGIRNKFITESFQGHQTKTNKSLILWVSANHNMKKIC